MYEPREAILNYGICQNGYVFRMSEWVKIAQSCPTLCNPIDCAAHGILQARILEWVAYPFSSGSSQPRNQTRVSCIAGRFFTNWAMREAPLGWDFLTIKQLKKKKKRQEETLNVDPVFYGHLKSSSGPAGLQLVLPWL